MIVSWSALFVFPLLAHGLGVRGFSLLLAGLVLEKPKVFARLNAADALGHVARELEDDHWMVALDHFESPAKHHRLGALDVHLDDVDTGDVEIVETHRRHDRDDWVDEAGFIPPGETTVRTDRRAEGREPCALTQCERQQLDIREFVSLDRVRDQASVVRVGFDRVDATGWAHDR